MNCYMCGQRLSERQMVYCSTSCRDEHLMRYRIFHKRHHRATLEYYREWHERLEQAQQDIYHLT